MKLLDRYDNRQYAYVISKCNSLIRKGDNNSIYQSTIY